MSYLKIFSCKTYAHIPNEKRNKLESKSIPHVFLGYCDGTKAYCLMCVETQKIIKSRNFVFLEGRTEVKGVNESKPHSKQGEHVFLWMNSWMREFKMNTSRLIMVDLWMKNQRNAWMVNPHWFFYRRRVTPQHDDRLKETQRTGQKK